MSTQIAILMAVVWISRELILWRGRIADRKHHVYMKDCKDEFYHRMVNEKVRVSELTDMHWASAGALSRAILRYDPQLHAKDIRAIEGSGTRGRYTEDDVDTVANRKKHLLAAQNNSA